MQAEEGRGFGGLASARDSSAMHFAESSKTSGMKTTTAGKLPSVDQFTPGPLPGEKRARVVSPPKTAAGTGTPAHKLLAGNHPRRRTVSSSGGPGKLLQAHATAAHSVQSMFSSDTPMAPPGSLTVNRNSCVPYTPIAGSVGSLASTNPPTKDITALTPPRLIIPTYASVPEAASPQSVAAALERMLSVTDKPVSTKSLPSPAPFLAAGLLQSPPNTRKLHSMSSQFHQHGSDSAPTPCSTPSKPSLPHASSSALATSAAASNASAGCSMMHDRAHRATSATTCATAVSGSALSAFAAPCLPVFSASVRASTPQPHMQAKALCPLADIPNGSVSLTGTLSETAVVVRSGTLIFSQQPVLTNTSSMITDRAASTTLVTDPRAHDHEYPPRPASVPAMCTFASPAVPTALYAGASELVCEDPQSPLLPLECVPAEGCMTQDAGHTPHRILKPVSVSPSEEHPRIDNRFEVSPALDMPMLDNEELMDCLRSGPNVNDRSRTVSPSPEGSGTPQAMFSLTTESVRMWNMRDAGTVDTGLYRSLSDMRSCGSSRSRSMSPSMNLTRERQQLHRDPIASPSQWDEEDELSIYKPQNLVFMPAGPSRAAYGVSTGDADMELPLSTEQDSITRGMKICTTTDLGTELPEDGDVAWHPWQLPQQTQVR